MLPLTFPINIFRQKHVNFKYSGKSYANVENKMEKLFIVLISSLVAGFFILLDKEFQEVLNNQKELYDLPVK